MSQADLSIETLRQHQEALRLLELERRLSQRNQLDSYFPDIGACRRELYPRHLEFFAAGATSRERCFMAANRIGKTSAGAYELTLHLTGLYPHWWKGRRFSHPVLSWASGDTSKTCRDIVQRTLLGPPAVPGTGMLPADSILRTTVKPGISDAIETIYVRHVSGCTSEVTLKSFDQGRESFVGTSRHVVWLDEEPDREIYVEALLRTMSCDGLILATMTPLRGMSDVCRDFLEHHEGSSRFCVTAGWDDCPHLSESAKAELLASIPPYQREARSKGVPQLGSGAIYPIPEADIVVPDFELPAHYPRAYALDVGWNKTAAVWGARDNETGVIYLYSEHYRGQAEPVVHAQAIQSRGKWISGVVDPAARGRSQVDGTQLIQMYRDCGLKLEPAENAVEAGIYQTWQLMSSGKLKVFRSLGNWLREFRLYQRDQDGRIVKQDDHLMDATRYLVMSGRGRMRTKPADKPEQKLVYAYPGQHNQRWMQ